MFLLRVREKCPLFKCWLCWPVKKHWNDIYPPSLIMKPANGRNVCFICDCVVFRSVSVHNVDISTMFLQWSLIGWFCTCCLCISTHVVKWLCTLLNEAVIHIFEIKIYFSLFSNQAQCLCLLMFYACLLTYYCLLMFPFINISVFIIGDVWEAYKKMAISHYCVCEHTCARARTESKPNQPRPTNHITRLFAMWYGAPFLRVKEGW